MVEHLARLDGPSSSPPGACSEAPLAKETRPAGARCPSFLQLFILSSLKRLDDRPQLGILNSIKTANAFQEHIPLNLP